MIGLTVSNTMKLFRLVWLQMHCESTQKFSQLFCVNDASKNKKLEVPSCVLAVSLENSNRDDNFFLFSFSDTLVLSVYCNSNSYRALDTYSLVCSAKTCFINKFSHQFCMELALLV